ncbi:MAG: P1 family peptidase [Planctomycetes bacterium]|nr:P1 family peptidase [Planctomycetota bacterium]
MHVCRPVLLLLLSGACAGRPAANLPIDEARSSRSVGEAGRRVRARDLGIEVGALPSGVHDAITDVPGVRVGHCTIDDGERFHTGVTVILPPGDNPFRDKVPAALQVQNGYGKLIGATQLLELGQLESPVALCGTLNVHRVADGVLDWLLGLPGNEDVRSINVVVGETNDGRLSDIRARPVTREHVREAIRNARSGDVAVGCVGAGAGTVCFGWKGGIGTASRLVRGHVIGVLVQTNFGGTLGGSGAAATPADDDGSCMIVVATDAPLDSHALGRLATRAFAGMARAGASFSNGSGDYAIAFSTTGYREPVMAGDRLSPLFVAVADATEQAIYDSLAAAETTTGLGRTVEAIPGDRLRAAAR